MLRLWGLFANQSTAFTSQIYGTIFIKKLTVALWSIIAPLGPNGAMKASHRADMDSFSRRRF
jgi:hypothetical protein